MEDNRVLAVGAHPDDVEFLMSGTLSLLYKQEFSIHIATIASGDMGSVELTSREISSKRYQEAVNSAEILEATYQTIGESDLHIVFENPARYKVAELIRKIDPYIVLTNSPQDYMMDHQLTADLVWDACFSAAVPNYHTRQPEPAEPIEHTPYLFYSDPIEGVNRFGERVRPEFYVDITSVMNIKEQMLAQHDSQRSWLREKHGLDQYIISMKEWSEQRGKEISVKYAEGFRQHKGHPFPPDNILEKLMGNLIIQHTE